VRLDLITVRSYRVRSCTGVTRCYIRLQHNCGEDGTLESRTTVGTNFHRGVSDASIGAKQGADEDGQYGAHVFCRLALR